MNLFFNFFRLYKNNNNKKEIPEVIQFLS